MIPNVAKRGKSFKGAWQYYGHDKRESWEKLRTTNERVGWTSVRNLSTDDPKLAISIMAATALNKDRLKEEAGIKRGGRQSKGDVYAYSLSWHPDEKETLTQTEMLKAADQSLQALGIEGYQAVIVAHNDEPHPHVHIIVNMVNPENGKNFSTSNDFRKLSQWALEYREARGEAEKYCVKRLERRQAIEAKNNGEQVPFVASEKMIPRDLHDGVSKVGGDVKEASVRELVTTQARENAALVVESNQLKVAQRERQKELSDDYARQRQEIKNAHREEKEVAKKRVIEQYLAVFERLQRQHKIEKEKFDKQEAVMIAQSIGAQNGFSEVFNMYGTKEVRRKELLRRHALDIKKLQQDQNEAIKRAVQKLQQNYEQRKDLARQTFMSAYDALKELQRLTKVDMQGRWSDREVSKDSAINALRSQGEIAKVDNQYLRDAFNDSDYKNSNDAA